MAEPSLSLIQSQLIAVLARIDNLVLVTEAPTALLGDVGSVAIDLTNRIFYGPKTDDAEDPWGEGVPFLEGPPGTDGADGIDGLDGSDGKDAWTPVFGAVADGVRRVLRVTDWTGGEGTKPTTGMYLGPLGLTATLGDATDVRGAAAIDGEDGSDGIDGWTPVLANVVDGERRVQQIVDWVGGEGAKPPTGLYVGPTGLTETIGSATNMRGAAGSNGSGSGDMMAANNLSDLTDKAAARTTLQVYSKTEADTAMGSKADLVGGKVSISQLPALAITDVFEVANQAAMLALTAERGDVAIRTDENKSYVLAAEPATTLANWKLLRTPTDVVLSVAGLTGAITKEALIAALEITAGGDASVVGDIKLSAVNPGSKWRPCNGATYLRSAYPDVGSILSNLTAPLASWTAKTKPAVSGIGAYGAGVYVLIPGSGTTYYTSPDGETWTTRTLPVNLSWQGFIFAGGQFVLMSGTRNVLISPDGINWTDQTTALPSGAIGGPIAYNGALYMSLDAGSAEVVYTSPDGLTWTPRARPGGAMSGARIAGGNGRFVITRVSSAEVYSTGDGGVTWTTGAMPSSTSWQGVAYGKGVFAAVANGGTVAAWSADGITWTSATMPVSSNWWHIAFVGQNFVALTFATGTVAAVSADGKTWASTTLSASASYNALIAGPRALALGGSSTTAALSNLLSDVSQFMAPVLPMPEPVVAYVKVLV